jgi:putative polyhydroxyalkanoic acid system protein
MSDNDLVLRIPHTLGAAEAKKRIADGVSAAKAQYGNYFKTSEIAWEGNRMTFCLTALAQTVRGRVDVENDYVELRAQLPTMIRLLAKRFVPVVKNTGQALLTKKT